MTTSELVENYGVVTVLCPDGKQALSGGAAVPEAAALNKNYPLDDLAGWEASASGPGFFRLRVYAVCATVAE